MIWILKNPVLIVPPITPSGRQPFADGFYRRTLVGLWISVAVWLDVGTFYADGLPLDLAIGGILLAFVPSTRLIALLAVACILVGLGGCRVDNGNTTVVIEHNRDIIKNADWIIDEPSYPACTRLAFGSEILRD